MREMQCLRKQWGTQSLLLWKYVTAADKNLNVKNLEYILKSVLLFRFFAFIFRILIHLDKAGQKMKFIFQKILILSCHEKKTPVAKIQSNTVVRNWLVYSCQFFFRSANLWNCILNIENTLTEVFYLLSNFNKTENPSSPYPQALYYFTAFLLTSARLGGAKA
jgi:hypothetical protein